MSQNEPARSWLCPRDESCPSNRHDDWQGQRRGCKSGAASESLRLYRKRRKFGIAPDLRDVPSVGTRRRLQALSAIGWTWRELAARLGCEESYPRHIALGRQSPDTCFRSTHDKVAALYEQLAATPGPSKRAVTVAQRRGWLTCMAWDRIDDPDEQPTVDSPAAAEPDVNLAFAAVAGRLNWNSLTRLDAEYVVTRLRHAGRENAEIADLLGCDPRDIGVTWERIRARELRAAKAAA